MKELEPLQELVKGKKVCVIAGRMPETWTAPKPLEDYDLVVRCNDHWMYDTDRCDILFHIASSPKLKVSWLLNELR